MLQAGTQRGVTSGTQQSMIENQLARQRAELGQTNLENALRQLGVANAYDEAAIRAKLAGDREVATALQNVISNLSYVYATQGQTQQQPLPPRQTVIQTQSNVFPDELISPRPGVNTSQVKGR